MFHKGLGGEDDDQRHGQGVNGDRFGESHAQDHVGLDDRSSIRVAAHSLHTTRSRQTYTDTGADSAEHGQTRTQQSHTLNKVAFHCMSLLHEMRCYFARLMVLVMAAVADRGTADEHSCEQEEHVGLDDAEEDLEQVQASRNGYRRQRADDREQQRAGENIAK